MAADPAAADRIKIKMLHVDLRDDPQTPGVTIIATIAAGQSTPKKVAVTGPTRTTTTTTMTPAIGAGLATVIAILAHVSLLLIVTMALAHTVRRIADVTHLSAGARTELTTATMIRNPSRNERSTKRGKRGSKSKKASPKPGSKPAGDEFESKATSKKDRAESARPGFWYHAGPREGGRVEVEPVS
jgi:hypothetical protein